MIELCYEYLSVQYTQLPMQKLALKPVLKKGILKFTVKILKDF